MKLIEIEMPELYFCNIWVEESKGKEIAKIKEVISFVRKNKIEGVVEWRKLVEDLFFDEDYNNTKQSIFECSDSEEGIFGNCETIIEVFLCRKGNYILEIDCQRENQCKREGITIINFENKEDLIAFLLNDEDTKYFDFSSLINN